MWIEPLFNHLGIPLTFALAVALVALPLGAVGAALRRRARRARTRWEVIGAARVPLAAIAPGRVAVEGTWRNLGPGRGAVVEGEECAVVEGLADGSSIADGTRVLVAGFATRQAENPQGGGYRGRGRVWVIEGDGAGEAALVSALPDLPSRGLRAARLHAIAGTALLAAGVAVTVGAGVLCYRAAVDDALYVSSDAE